MQSQIEKMKYEPKFKNLETAQQIDNLMIECKPPSQFIGYNNNHFINKMFDYSRENIFNNNFDLTKINAKEIQLLERYKANLNETHVMKGLKRKKLRQIKRCAKEISDRVVFKIEDYKRSYKVSTHKMPYHGLINNHIVNCYTIVNNTVMFLESSRQEKSAQSLKEGTTIHSFIECSSHRSLTKSSFLIHQPVILTPLSVEDMSVFPELPTQSTDSIFPAEGYVQESCAEIHKQRCLIIHSKSYFYTQHTLVTLPSKLYIDNNPQTNLISSITTEEYLHYIQAVSHGLLFIANNNFLEACNVYPEFTSVMIKSIDQSFNKSTLIILAAEVPTIVRQIFELRNNMENLSGTNFFDPCPRFIQQMTYKLQSRDGLHEDTAINTIECYNLFLPQISMIICSSTENLCLVIPSGFIDIDFQDNICSLEPCNQPSVDINTMMKLKSNSYTQYSWSTIIVCHLINFASATIKNSDKIITLEVKFSLDDISAEKSLNFTQEGSLSKALRMVDNTSANQIKLYRNHSMLETSAFKVAVNRTLYVATSYNITLCIDQYVIIIGDESWLWYAYNDVQRLQHDNCPSVHSHAMSVIVNGYIRLLIIGKIHSYCSLVCQCQFRDYDVYLRFCYYKVSMPQRHSLCVNVPIPIFVLITDIVETDRHANEMSECMPIICSNQAIHKIDDCSADIRCLEHNTNKMCCLVGRCTLSFGSCQGNAMYPQRPRSLSI